MYVPDIDLQHHFTFEWCYLFFLLLYALKNTNRCLTVFTEVIPKYHLGCGSLLPQ